MKSRKISLEEDVECIEICIKLFNLLEDFNIPSAEKINEDLKYTLEEDCCHDCQARKDDCTCRDGRYMAEYDDGADYED